MKKFTLLLMLILTCVLTIGMLASCSEEENEAASDDVEAAVEHCNHTFGDWVVLKKESCTESGLKERYCYYCDEKISVKPAATDHTWVEATCLAPKTCSTCLITEGTLADHTPTVLAAVKQTCTKEGLTEGSKCSVCEKTLIAQEVIPCHTRVLVPGYASTCSKTGLTDGEKCTKCKKILVKQQVISRHEPVIFEGLDSTCITNGLTKGTTCTVCNEKVSGQFMIEFLEHKYDKDGTCSVCLNKKPTDFIDYSSVSDSYGLTTKYTGNVTDVVVSSTYNGKLVTYISADAFAGNTSITSITLPNTITEIQDGAFAGCTNLKTVVFAPNSSVSSLNSFLFKDCTSLESISIPDSVTTVYNTAFDGCTALVKSENGISYADSWAIGFDSNATEYKLRDNTVGIAISAFEGCAVKSLTIPNTVRNIGAGAFKDCAELTSVTLPTGLTKICNNSFDSCSKLASITIPSTVVTIEAKAFYNCSSLTTLTIPESVELIGSNAFQKCSGLNSVKFENIADWYTRDDNSTEAIYVNVDAENAERLSRLYARYEWFRQQQ